VRGGVCGYVTVTNEMPLINGENAVEAIGRGSNYLYEIKSHKWYEKFCRIYMRRKFNERKIYLLFLGLN
jgi:hypothetical protein